MSSAQLPVSVLDTNIVLDLFLFQDSRTDGLRQAIAQGAVTWIATPHMRSELERVLTYPNIVAKLACYQHSAASILVRFDQHTTLCAAPAQKAPYTCKDTDDQVFIDLAYHLALKRPSQIVQLISKDKAVLSMRKRLAKLSIHVSSSFFS